MRTTSACHLSPNAIQIEIKPTFSFKPVPLLICTRTHIKILQANLPILYPVLTQSPLSRGTDTDMLTPLSLFSFFQFSLEAQSPQLLSKENTSSVGKGGGKQKVTLRCHIGVYCTGHETHRDKLPTSHLLLMARQVFAITHICIQVVWA